MWFCLSRRWIIFVKEYNSISSYWILLISRCDSVITRISNSTAKCWTKFVLFLILCILILHKEMELSLALLSKLGSIGQFPDHDLVRHYRSLKWSEKQIKERKYLHLGLNSGVQGGTRTIKNTVCLLIRYFYENRFVQAHMYMRSLNSYKTCLWLICKLLWNYPLGFRRR